MHSVEYSSGRPVIEIHDIYEENDSVLYAVTAVDGFIKWCLKRKEGLLMYVSKNVIIFS